MNPKQRLRNKADKLWKEIILKHHPMCEGCGTEPSNTGHHFFPKGLYGHLRYDIDNGIGIGIKCHFAHHHKGCPVIHQNIIKKRGIKWYNELKYKALNPPKDYKLYVSWYKKQINILNKYETSNRVPNNIC